MEIEREVLEEFRHFSEEEMAEIQSALNRWGTGLEFGPEQDLWHLAAHYVRYARTIEGRLYCKFPKVGELAGERMVLPDMDYYNNVQIVFARVEFQKYRETHGGLEPEIPIPKNLPEEEKQRYVLMMFFCQNGMMADFSEQYTCPERLLGVGTEELKCRN